MCVTLVPAGTSKLDVSDLSAVLEDIHDAHDKWYGIGLRLGLTQTVLKGLEQEYQKTEEMLREMLGHWLKQVTPAPTWDALFQALRSKTVNEPSLAEQLLEKHHILPHGKCIVYVLYMLVSVGRSAKGTSINFTKVHLISEFP